ncbi:MAG TPA: hypothetical protein VGF92_23335 [Stellaceae bacterium]
MADTSRIKIKINGAEFEAEGTPEDVKAQYEAFVELMKAAPSPSAPPQPPPKAATPPDSGNGASEQSAPRSVAADFLNRIYDYRKDGTVTLKVLPKGQNRDADALLLLLYGYKQYKDADNVFGAQLMKAAKLSGIQVERIDRALAPHSSYLIRGGRKRSANYTLNNQGITAAEAITKTIFD